MGIRDIHSGLSKCSTARRSGSGLAMGGPTKVKARRFFLCTEGSLKVEINTGLCPIKVSSNAIELTMQTSCYSIMRHPLQTKI